MKRSGLYALAVLLAIGATGCGTIKATKRLSSAAFTQAQLSDLQLEGIKSGPCIPLRAFAAGDVPEAQRAALSDLLGDKSVGCLLPLTRVGETKPFWIFCTAGSLEQECAAIPANAHVTFQGQPLGLGGVWVPNRLTWAPL